ncbi:MAG: AzlD family protein [Geminicoccaceae bacterium]
MPSDMVSTLAVIVMAAVTYSTRFMGMWIMSFVPLTGRVQAFLAALSGSVLVALVVPAAVNGDLAVKAGVLCAFAVMLVTRHTLAAMSSGIVLAALLRNLMPIS